MSDRNSQEDSTSRLTSLLPSSGGGLQSRGSGGSTSKHTTTSLLGLDRLAARKREENNDGIKRSYRRIAAETPSLGPGLNREVYQSQIDKRHNQQRGQRQYQPYPTAPGRSKNPDAYRDGSNHRESSERRGNHGDYSRRSISRPGDGDLHDNDRRRNDSSRSGHSYRDQQHGQYHKNQSGMPPPLAVTPSTQASTSNMRRRDRVDAATPRRQQADRSSVVRATPATSRSSWEETPLVGPRDDDDLKVLAKTRPRGDGDDDFDRHFYLDQEEGGYVLDSNNADNGQADMGRFLFENSKTRAREQEMEQKRQNRFNPRKSAQDAAQEAWEENRLLSSGAAVRSNVDLEMTTEQDTNVTLLVHQVKPPFLDGRVSFSTIREAVPTVKDASSDFAKMAREGSAVLRHLRANKDKNTMRQKFWELGGTRMGDAVGVQKEEDEETKKDQPAVTESGEIDYKKSSGFAEHMKKQTNGPASAFARNKTIRQQREYLPVYSVRDELLNVLRENTCVVIVGETGSGKVCLVDHLLCCLNLPSSKTNMSPHI